MASRLQCAWILLLIFFSCGFQTGGIASDQADIKKQILKLVDVGAVMMNNEKSQPVFAHQIKVLLVPASIIKILTSLVAIELLGKEFRFTTEFYVDQHNNLLIRGLGDPFLVSEEISDIAKSLKELGLRRINRLILDHSAFAPNIEIPGTSGTLKPYDALNGALVVNFNTLNLGRDRSGVVFSAETETPLTPLAMRKGEMMPRGKTERINLSDKPRESSRYVGELFQRFFADQQIFLVNKEFGVGTLSSSWTLFYTHQNSKPLELMLSGLLKYSSNFIANQIFLTIGAREYGYPAELRHARSVFRKAIERQFRPLEQELFFDEASGLSRANMITAKMMMKVLEVFRPYSHLLPEQKGVLVKSGTLTGIYNYAGYIQTDKGLRPFVIMLNQTANYRDKILNLLLDSSDQ